MFRQLALAAVAPGQTAESPKAAPAAERPVVVEGKDCVERVRAVRGMPYKRKHAEAIAIVAPEKRKYARELPVPPQRREEGKIRATAVALPPEEREHAIVIISRVELRDRPQEIELVIFAATVLLVL